MNLEFKYKDKFYRVNTGVGLNKRWITDEGVNLGIDADYETKIINDLFQLSTDELMKGVEARNTLFGADAPLRAKWASKVYVQGRPQYYRMESEYFVGYYASMVRSN